MKTLTILKQNIKHTQDIKGVMRKKRKLCRTQQRILKKERDDVNVF